MLTISRLTRWSIRYYNDTANEAKQAAMDRQAANGGLGEYYSEGDTRIPTWLVVGDTAAVGEATGLDGAALDGGFADTDTAARWLDDGIAPNGATGRAFTKESVHGFDLTFAAPKSVSLLRALTDDVAEKVLLNAHTKAVNAAMTYLHQHAGYTRVHNPLTGQKDLQRLPGLVAIAYQHETSRCGDPHLHTHVIVPNRQARADGQLVSIDSKSLHHEAKAAGIIYQATLRHELHAERGSSGTRSMSTPGWPRSPASTKDMHQGVVAALHPAAGMGARQPGRRRRRTHRRADWRPRRKPPGPPSRNRWRGRRSRSSGAPMRAGWCWTATHTMRRATRARSATARSALDRARIARMAAHIDKAAFTRADMVELVGAQLPVDAPGDPRALIEQIVDDVSVRISATREAHHREGHEKFTVDAIIAEEERVFGMVDEADNRTPSGRARRRPRRPVAPTRNAPSATSPSRRFWCSRCRPPPARAKPTR